MSIRMRLISRCSSTDSPGSSEVAGIIAAGRRCLFDRRVRGQLVGEFGEHRGAATLATLELLDELVDLGSSR